MDASRDGFPNPQNSKQIGDVPSEGEIFDALQYDLAPVEIDEDEEIFFNREELSKVAVSGQRSTGHISDHGSRENSSIAEWTHRGDIFNFYEQHNYNTAGGQDMKRWSSQPHTSLAQLQESNGLYRTSSYPEQQQHQQFSSEPIMVPNQSIGHLNIPHRAGRSQIQFTGLNNGSHFGGNMHQLASGSPVNNGMPNQWVNQGELYPGGHPNTMNNLLQQQLPLHNGSIPPHLVTQLQQSQQRLLPPQSLQFQQQQLDINNIIAEQLEKVRIEIEEERKRQLRKIMEAIEVRGMKILKTKEDEIEKIGKLNWALEEKVKSLCIENQMWRNLAQTNEATANALSHELERVRIHHAGGDENGATVSPGGAAAETALMDDASSCCGSTDGENKKKDNEGVKDKDGGSGCVGESNGKGIIGKSGDNNGLCIICGKEESCVLILPCRHLCLCNTCCSSLDNCPICKSFKKVSVNINMS